MDIVATPVAVEPEKLTTFGGPTESVSEPSAPHSKFGAEVENQNHSGEKSFIVDPRSGNGPLPPGRSNENAKDEAKFDVSV